MSLPPVAWEYLDDFAEKYNMSVDDALSGWLFCGFNHDKPKEEKYAVLLELMKRSGSVGVIDVG